MLKIMKCIHCGGMIPQIKPGWSKRGLGVSDMDEVSRSFDIPTGKSAVIAFWLDEEKPDGIAMCSGRIVDKGPLIETVMGTLIDLTDKAPSIWHRDCWERADMPLQYSGASTFKNVEVQQ